MIGKYFFVPLLLLLVLIPGGSAFDPALSGERNLGQEFTFQILNVSNQADIFYHYQVYAARILGRNYTYWSPAWGQPLVQEAPAGLQYLAVWIRGWTDENSTASWGFDTDRFRLWVWSNRTITALDTPLQDRPIRYESIYYRPAVIRDLEGRVMPDGGALTTDWYGWKDWYDLDTQLAGRSNAWDGITLWLIPEEATEEDIRVLLDFGFYGYGVWYLTDHVARQEINKRNLEYKIVVRKVSEGSRGKIERKTSKPVRGT